MNMTTVPSNQLKAMQQEIADLKETIAQQAEYAVVLEAAKETSRQVILAQQETIEQQAEQIADLVATNATLDAEWKKTTADKFAEMAEAIRLKDAALDWCIGEFNLRLDDIDLSQETIRVLSARHIQPSPEILQARDEPVAYLDANYGFMRCGNAADHLPIGTKLYAVPPQPAPSVPEGYQLVPIEPTEAMQEAWDGESSLMGTWNAMLAAARSE